MTESTKPLGRTALIAGVGNIGSHLAVLLLQAGLGRVKLVDRDRVEAKNLIAQDYRPEDVGQLKAEVQARRLRERFPDRVIEAWPVDLEDLPAGVACVDVVLGALDSRRARQALISELAWPLGVPVVDGGVGDNHIGRVQVFLPGDQTACLECTWGAADYRLAAAEYPCLPGGSAQAAPTGAPAFLGAFTASVMTHEGLRILQGPTSQESYEAVFDLQGLTMRRFRLRRSGRCRLDHTVVGEAITVGDGVADLLAAVQSRFGDEPVRLEVRRGLGRFLTVEGLRASRQASLAELGFVPNDRIRARGEKSAAWLCVPGDGRPS